MARLGVRVERKNAAPPPIASVTMESKYGREITVFDRGGFNADFATLNVGDDPALKAGTSPGCSLLVDRQDLREWCTRTIEMLDQGGK